MKSMASSLRWTALLCNRSSVNRQGAALGHGRQVRRAFGHHEDRRHSCASRTHREITPAAALKPVPIGGARVSRATFHNMDEIDRLGVKIGDWVEVERGGDVIPKVTRVIRGQRSSPRLQIVPYAGEVPVCGGHVVRTEGEADHRCINANCPAKLRETILHFASRGVMNIEGMGDALVNQLTDRKLVKNVADIFEFTKDDLLSLERMGDKSAENVLNEIEASKKLPLDR